MILISEMGKDPAFLFYPEKFVTGTALINHWKNKWQKNTIGLNLRIIFLIKEK